MEAVPKIEGHAAFYAHLKNGHVDKARMIGLENDRFVEKILLGRKFWEAPIITSRICGICPTIHNVTSTKAIEAACGIKATDQTKRLRKLMLAAQMIQSHSLHLYLLVLPDFVGASSSFELQKSHPELFKNAIILKRYADKIIETTGGRAVHPIASVPGGFKSLPKKKDLETLLDMSEEVEKVAKDTIYLLNNFKYPMVKREIIYSSLHHDKEYAFYDGEIWTTDGTIFDADNYTSYLYEELKPYTRAKFGTFKGKEMTVGAAARINLNRKNLSRETRAIMIETNAKVSFDNPFDNTMAQAYENYHFVIKSIESLNYFLKNPPENEHLRPPVTFGLGTAACEAPRGTLFHHYELDENGIITKCDIVTPTVQSLPAMELDIKGLEPIIKSLNAEERNKTIEMLIRAYDPCITCATH